MNTNIIIVGGGAAGLVAAIVAARNGARVTIIEHKEKIGKKILATGNGKCNYTNLLQSIDCYRGENLSFAGEVFSHFDAQATVTFFKQLGIYPKSRNGYLYPNSEQASSVVEVLEMELRNLDVHINCNEDVVSIRKNGKSFYIDTIETGKDTGRKSPHQGSMKDSKEKVRQRSEKGKNQGVSIQGSSQLEKKKSKQAIVYQSMEQVPDRKIKRYVASKLILATGGKASSALGSDGSGYRLASSLGHQLISPVPALVQLKAAGNFFPSIAGVRCDVSLELFVEKSTALDDSRLNAKVGEKHDRKEFISLATESGELQITNYGISGIPVFQISRFAARALERNEKVTVRIDFLPQFSLEDLHEVIRDRIDVAPHKSTEQMLAGLLNSKLISLFIEEAGIPRNMKVNMLKESHFSALLELLKNFQVRITDTNSFENAQVCAGGVDTKEVDSTHMESKIVSGLYLAGELLDIDGICGGYNLQWAWSTGYLAGKAAAES